MRFTLDIDDPLRFLAACPAYRPSPLQTLRDPSGVMLLAKDETDRMGLGSHKGLGGIYAIARLIEQAWTRAGGAPLAPDDLLGEKLRAFARGLTFVCASAGNHGLAVAAGARVFGARARIHLSATVPKAFAARLAARGAEVVRSGAIYEQSLAAAIADAETTGAILLADTCAEGEDCRPPALVMEGYAVIAEELRAQCAESGLWPDRIYLQGGVGGTAAAIARGVRELWPTQPEIAVVEPDRAACLAASRALGRPAAVTGAVSNMGRLDCKEASPIAFEALEASDVRYLAVSDAEAEDAAAWLTTQGLATTPSGAAGLAGLRQDIRADRPRPTRALILVSEGREADPETIEEAAP